MRTDSLACVVIVIGAIGAPIARSLPGRGSAWSFAAAGARNEAGQETDAALRARASTSLRKAVEFYRTKVATEGGYHFAYAEDLSYGRSEMSEGPTRVEIQREGTPLVGMAYLEAYAATADTYYLEAARDVARVARERAVLQRRLGLLHRVRPVEAGAVSVPRRRRVRRGVKPPARSGRRRSTTT